MIFDTEGYFKLMADTNNWSFVYGRKDYQNLYDVLSEVKETFDCTDAETVLFCQELSYDLKTNKVNVEIILANKSDFVDGGYSERNEKSILPIKRLMNISIFEKIGCEHNIEKCMMYDKINEFDSNLDGVMANIILEILV